MLEAELWASWRAVLPFRVCFLCEDRPAIGRLVLVDPETSELVRKGPPVCGFCRPDADGVMTQDGRWVFLGFRD